MATPRKTPSKNKSTIASKRARPHATEHNARGRPTSYRPEYAQMLVDFFTPEPDSVLTNDDGNPVIDERSGLQVRKPTRIPHLIDFAKSIGVPFATVKEWPTAIDSKTKELLYPDFSAVYKNISHYYERLLMHNGLTGAWESRIVNLALKNKAGWADKVDTNVTDTIGGKLLDQLARIEAEKLAESRQMMGEVEKRVGSS